MKLLEEIMNDADGALMIRDWLGHDGIPVHQQAAEYRAEICRTCPENRGFLWWEKMTKNPIAAGMRDYIAVKNEMTMRVKSEEDLHLCKVCLCCLPLKIWVPIAHVKAHTSDRVMKRLPDHCWIKKEIGV